jgi:hypothetical protein
MKAPSLFAVALAAILVPAAASAAPAASRTALDTGLSVGGFIGYETDDLSGITLRVDGEMPFGALSPQINLSWVGSLGFSHLTDEVGGTDLTANILKVVPAARFSFPLNPQFTLFADAGLGLYYSSWTIESPVFTGFPVSGGEVDGSEIGLLLRLGGGAWFHVNPKTRIGAAIEFNPYFGDVIGNDDQSTFIIQVGAMFRL